MPCPVKELDSIAPFIKDSFQWDRPAYRRQASACPLACIECDVGRKPRSEGLLRNNGAQALRFSG